MKRRYEQVYVGNRKSMDLHRFLMQQHIGRKLRTYEHVHHKDDNPLNNSIDNLEILTQSQHMSLHHKGKTISEEQRKTCSENNKGSKNAIAKFTEEQVLDIRKQLANGVSARKLSCEYKVSDMCISLIKLRKSWKHI